MILAYCALAREARAMPRYLVWLPSGNAGGSEPAALRADGAAARANLRSVDPAPEPRGEAMPLASCAPEPREPCCSAGARVWRPTPVSA